MNKAKRLEFKNNIGPTSATKEEVERNLREGFTQVNPELTLNTEELSLDDAGNIQGVVYITGEQPAPLDFAALAKDALGEAIDSLRSEQGLPPVAVPQDAVDEPWIRSVHNEDEDEGLIEPPPLPEMPAAPSVPPTEPRPRPRKRLFDDEEGAAEADAPKPQALEDCPLGGDGGDNQLNEMKNRTNSGNWREVSIQDLLDLDWPEGIERRKRANWTPEALKEVLANEKKGAIELTGWFASAKKEDEESCNCHSPDEVDYHLWIVDDPTKTNKNERWQSVVCEVTPRVRGEHTGWDIKRIGEVIRNRTEVRIMGWLMMDQEHPEQLQKTRGTLWEMHPIIEFYVKQEGEWVPLDDADL